MTLFFSSQLGDVFQSLGNITVKLMKVLYSPQLRLPWLVGIMK